MKKNLVLPNWKESKTMRLSIEILISILFFSWLPLILQIIAVIIISLIFEFIFAKITTQNLKNKLSSEAISQILVNSQQQERR